MGVIQHGPQRKLITVRQGISEQIDGVINACRPGKFLRQGEFALGFRGKLGQLQTDPFNGIGRHDSGAAGVGDHGHPFSTGQGLKSERPGIIELVLDRFAANHAGPFKNTFIGAFGLGQSPGVRQRGPRSGLGKTGLHQKNGFLPADSLCLPDKGVAIDDRFQIAGDDLGVGVLSQRPDDG